MSRNVAPNERGERLLDLVPANLESATERTLEARTIDALGDAVLQTFNRAELNIAPEVPITKEGEPYSKEEVVAELSVRYDLSEDIARLVVGASKEMLEKKHNKVQ